MDRFLIYFAQTSPMLSKFFFFIAAMHFVYMLFSIACWIDNNDKWGDKEKGEANRNIVKVFLLFFIFCFLGIITPDKKTVDLIMEREVLSCQK